MKTVVTFCLLLALALPLAAVEDGEVMYVGGTTPSLRPGTIGRLDTTSETSLAFEYSGARLVIPYSSIQNYQYSSEVTHHLGVLPAIAIGLVKKRQRRHFFRITYLGADNVSQVAILEVPKHMPRTLQAVLDSRAPKPPRAIFCCPHQN